MLFAWFCLWQIDIFLSPLTAFSVQPWFASDFLQSGHTRRPALAVGLDFTVF